MSEQDKRITVRVEELAYSNMIPLSALLEFPEEKGVVRKQEVLNRVNQLQTSRKHTRTSRIAVSGKTER